MIIAGIKKTKCLIVIFILTAVWSWILPPAVEAGEAGHIWKLAHRAVLDGKQEVAFSYFRSIVRNFPRSKYYRLSLFGVGEFYKKIGDLSEAEKIFTQIVQDNPDRKDTMFALAQMLDIARQKQNNTAIKKYERMIIEFKQVSLVFKEFEEFSFRSPFNQKYKVIHRINHIEFMINDQPFAEISY